LAMKGRALMRLPAQGHGPLPPPTAPPRCHRADPPPGHARFHHTQEERREEGVPATSRAWRAQAAA
jgi:hypothetical protein